MLFRGALQKVARRFLSLAEFDKWITYGTYGLPGISASVTEDRAMTITAVYSCVKMVSEDLGSLPLNIYRRLDDRSKEKDITHPLHYVLNHQTNPFMDGMSFKTTLTAHALTWGNAYAEIVYSNDTEVVEMWPLHPSCVRPMWNKQKTGVIYEVRLPSGQKQYLPDYKVFHLKNIVTGGLKGLSPISACTTSFGLAQSADQYASKFFENGAVPKGILTTEGKIPDGKIPEMKKAWNETYGGLNNAHRIAILEYGMKYENISISPEDSQLLETRKFALEDIARIYRIPPHKLGHLDRATFNNIEELSTDYVISAVRPWAVRWENALHVQLMGGRERETYYGEYNMDALLRGDIETRYKAYHIGWQDSFLTTNDIRAKENMNPVDGGDTRYVPLNMVPAEMAGDKKQQESNALPAVTEDRRREATMARTIASRNRLRTQYYPLFTDKMAQVVRREVNDIRSAIKKAVSRDDMPEFLNWIENYYRFDLADYLSKNMIPVFRSYADAVTNATFDEVGQEYNPASSIDLLTEGYNALHTKRYTGSSEGQIKKIVKDIQEKAEGDVNAAIESEVARRIDEWEEARPDKVADRETVQLGNATANVVIFGSGLRSMWVNQGSENCPYCQKMHGRIISRGQYFVNNGDSVEADGNPPMKSYENKQHPPLHQGCDCIVAPTR